jgi:hypothetical protein
LAGASFVAIGPGTRSKVAVHVVVAPIVTVAV